VLTAACATSAGGAGNEDYVVTTPEVVVVLDGVSTWYTPDSGCRHGTRWYVRRLGHACAELAAAAPETALGTILGEAIATVAASHVDTCDLGHPWSPAAAVAILRTSPSTVEQVVLGDCAVVLDVDGQLDVTIDGRLSELDRRARAGGPDSPLHQHLMTGFSGLRNRPDGYWIASTDPAAGAHACTRVTSIERVRRACLLTDGAWALVGGYDATWPQLMGLAADGGPHAVLAEVRRREHLDPLCRRWPRSKRHDDATVAVCGIGG
jgi:hypothetical protein